MLKMNALYLSVQFLVLNCGLVTADAGAPYLAPPATSRDRVHHRLQAERVIAFIAHVTHQHLGVLAWVPMGTQQITKSSFDMGSWGQGSWTRRATESNPDIKHL